MTAERPVALITGGTRGIGLALATRLGRDGYDLFLGYKSDETQANEARAQLSDLGANVWLFPGDTRDAAVIREMVKAIKEGPGRIDLLVHNASFGTMGPVTRIGPRSWNATFETNVTALLQLAQKTLPFLKEQKGKIIAISSIGSMVCYSDYAAMGCSKAAMESLVKYLAFELAKDGVRVNAVSGGPIETRALGSFKDPDAVRNYARGMGPFGRMGEPDDLVGAVSFLASPDAQWITGQILVVDGGVTLGIDFDDWKEPRERP